ncbi:MULTISPECIES: cation:proton antiporter [unclassified Sphingopyxis]|uniref:cation:proton antiporter n=1 Tax=unclassified Sphingopyxis TaxID=2614943 RepID=UPI0006C675A5|nr:MULTISPECIES: cation:proton antiporter [unclassified Sphingopyxis]USI75450.1 cation:proton antiporter [Sphingopyxis sp. USTB-05]GAO78045.1 Na(+)/H(+) antiporter [Sphingopyxis sp. C-1]
MAFLIDLVCFLIVPVLCWRLVRGAVPMAVLPILAGMAFAIAADRFGFDKSVLGPSEWGETIGWLGVLVLAFSAGLETRVTTKQAPRIGGRVVRTALIALAVPFAVGFAVALSGALDVVLARPAGVSPLLSAGAIGLCLAVSALPVLVGIVRELPMSDRPLGNLSLRIAALDDAILWIGLALLLFLHKGETGALLAGGLAQIGAIAVLATMIAARGGLVRRLPDHIAVSVLLGIAYLAAGAWATSMLGLHELLGAYFAGVLAPQPLAERLRPETLGKVALFGLSPLFFAHRGLSIDGAVVTAGAVGAALALLLLASVSKLAAVHLAPPDPDMPAAERTRLGLLLQCKGLMEIVAATILVQAGLITPTVFAVLVTLALVSTTLTVPLFRLASRTNMIRAAA